MKKRIILSSFCVLYALGVIAAIVILTTGTIKKETKRNPLGNFESITGMSKKDVIGIIKINAPIFFNSKDSNFFVQERGAFHWLEQLNYAATNDRIKAVIIQVNSPGGTVGASQELYEAVRRIQKAGKPVITSIADLSASGGYYATVSSDKIFANPGSLVGSIGVILGGMEITDLLVKVGIKYQAITSGKNKDILSPYKKMTEEQRILLQSMVNNTYEQFVRAVAEGRKKSIDEIYPYADGSVYTGEQAIQNGLIDELGTFYDVIAFTKETYNLKTATIEEIVPKATGFNFSEILSLLAPNTTPEVKINLGNKNISSMGYAPILYLYQF